MNNNQGIFVEQEEEEEGYDNTNMPNNTNNSKDDESPWERKMRRRRRRRRRMAVGGTVGLVLGIVLFTGPFAAIGVAAGGVVAARVMSKRGEFKKDQRCGRKPAEEKYFTTTAFRK